MGDILIWQWLWSIEVIFKGALAESSWPISCNLWYGWNNIIVYNL